jgi:hypothetical protein
MMSERAPERFIITYFTMIYMRRMPELIRSVDKYSAR